MKGSSRIAVTIVAGAVGFFLYWAISPWRGDYGLFEFREAERVGAAVLGFIATLTGVFLGTAYRKLSAIKAAGRDDVGKLKVFFRSLLGSVDLWMGLIASPLVFALLLQASAGMSLPGLLVVALENGFCCLLIAESLLNRPPGDVRPAVP